MRAVPYRLQHPQKPTICHSSTIPSSLPSKTVIRQSVRPLPYHRHLPQKLLSVSQWGLYHIIFIVLENCYLSVSDGSSTPSLTPSKTVICQWWFYHMIFSNTIACQPVSEGYIIPVSSKTNKNNNYVLPLYWFSTVNRKLFAWKYFLRRRSCNFSLSCLCLTANNCILLQERFSDAPSEWVPLVVNSEARKKTALPF